MIKYLISAIVIALVGCVTQPEKPYYPTDMKNFVASCQQAHNQIDFLSQQINEYNDYHKTHPVTLEDQRYYGKLKNNLWSLRSTCSAKYL
jgi:hypothetical protein